MQRSWLLASVSLLACVDQPVDDGVVDLPVAHLQTQPAPAKFVPKPDGIAGEWIVVMHGTPNTCVSKLELDASIDRVAARHNARVEKRFGAALRGFSARMSEHKVRRLTVLNREKRLVGIISLGDISLGDTSVSAAAPCQVSEPGGPHTQH